MQIRTIYAASKDFQDQALITEYIALRAKHFKGSTYSDKRDEYDGWPDTVFVIGTDNQGKVLAGGRFIFSPAEQERRLHFERDANTLSFNHLFTDRNPFHTSYGEFGAVVADPYGSEQMAGLMLEAGALKLVSDKALPEFQRADVIIGSVVPRNQKIVLRAMRGTDLDVRIIPDMITRDGEPRMVMACILNEELRSASLATAMS